MNADDIEGVVVSELVFEPDQEIATHPCYKPKDNTQPTFPGNKKRLDWILISSHWNFENHRTLPDQVSDHLAVIAEVSLTTGQAAD